ncbi:uncharacterized protein LOC119390845 [Rhipicephalus sanguineus]|uniref:uncharacterized protein LOC119390845 n=1 Tax=Rhipicephalus sanguineus TaxID=34632 RepID=UPI001893419C|nr:uncharacterized protein LOC119390845 [Rhipicephalus sanguineus]
MKIICFCLVLCVAATILAHSPHGPGGRRRGGPRGFGRRPALWFAPGLLRQLCDQIRFPTTATAIPGVTTDGSSVSVSFASESTMVSSPSDSAFTSSSTEMTPQGITFTLVG